MTRYIVMDKTAHMPNSVRAPYRRVAVVETDLLEGREPAMISAHAKGVVRIVKTWERCHARGVKTAYQRALAEAYQLAAKLNSAPWEAAPRIVHRDGTGLWDE